MFAGFKSPPPLPRSTRRGYLSLQARRHNCLGLPRRWRVLRLDELDEHTPSCPGVDERHLVPSRAATGHAIDHGDAEALEQRDRLLDALHLDRNVVQSRAALLEEPG